MNQRKKAIRAYNSDWYFAPDGAEKSNLDQLLWRRGVLPKRNKRKTTYQIYKRFRFQ